MDILENGLAQLGLTSEQLTQKLREYIGAIEAGNEFHSLVNASGDELVIKHILDSLAGFAPLCKLFERCYPKGSELCKIADFGSGAGLPGIPLALACEYTVLPSKMACEFSLIDRMSKRIHFLEEQKVVLGMDALNIIEAQVEHLKSEWDIITFRAFRPFERKLFKKIFASLKKGGYIMAYKGKQEKVEGELPELAGLYRSVDIVALNVPHLADERCLVILQK